jgi:hypothetical protein
MVAPKIRVVHARGAIHAQQPSHEPQSTLGPDEETGNGSCHSPSCEARDDIAHANRDDPYLTTAVYPNTYRRGTQIATKYINLASLLLSKR